MKHEAILKLYPNVKSIIEDKNEIVAKDENNNIVSLDMSAVDAKTTELQSAEDAKENQKATDKANGNQKLLELGLSQAEATALTGYTPPVED